MADLETLKRQYRVELEPFISFLKVRKSEMSQLVWSDAVRRLEQSVLKSPEQYLAGLSVKNRESTIAVVKVIFSELLLEE